MVTKQELAVLLEPVSIGRMAVAGAGFDREESRTVVGKKESGRNSEREELATGTEVREASKALAKEEERKELDEATLQLRPFNPSNPSPNSSNWVSENASR